MPRKRSKSNARVSGSFPPEHPAIEPHDQPDERHDADGVRRREVGRARARAARRSTSRRSGRRSARRRGSRRRSGRTRRGRRAVPARRPTAIACDALVVPVADDGADDDGERRGHRQVDADADGERRNAQLLQQRRASRRARITPTPTSSADADHLPVEAAADDALRERRDQRRLRRRQRVLRR